jgi:hypothetical protein
MAILALKNDRGAKPHSPGLPLYNKSHPMARGLVFGALPGGMHRQDIVSGNLPSAISGNFNDDRTSMGSAFHSNSTSTDYVAWPLTDRIKSITKSFTIAVWYRVDGEAAYSSLVNVPYRVGSWNAPYRALGLYRNNASGFMSLSKSLNSSTGIVKGGGVWPGVAPDLNFSGVTCNDTDLYFYDDTDRFGLGTWTSGAVDWSTADDIVLLNRSSSSNGEGTDGAIPLVFLWNRALEHREIQALHVDPYVFINPPPPGVSKQLVPSVEQEGFRFREDDGSESAASWRQAQDVDDTISKEANFRLRFLLNATNDPATDAYKIQYKKTSDGDSSYKDILPT